MRRKIYGAVCLLAAVLLLAACGPVSSGVPDAAGDIQPPEQTSGSLDETDSVQPEEADGIMVIYFSATGSTRAAAGYIADALAADTYEITPEEPYTSDDLDWRNDSSRVSKEHEDPAARPALSGELPDLEGYDTVFLGYPIWWGEAPGIIYTFLESVDLSGKTVIPFCTSSSSGLGESAEHLHDLAPEAVWLEGTRFQSRTAEADVTAWVNGLNIME